MVLSDLTVELAQVSDKIENCNNQPELNGSGSAEIMSWPIKKD
jgi:hypothetical protein